MDIINNISISLLYVLPVYKYVAIPETRSMHVLNYNHKIFSINILTIVIESGVPFLSSPRYVYKT